MNESEPRSAQGAATLLTDAISHVTSLVRSEMDLARAEIDQNLRRAATALGMIVAGGVAALTALGVLAAAIVAGLTEAGLEPGSSAQACGRLGISRTFQQTPPQIGIDFFRFWTF